MKWVMERPRDILVSLQPEAAEAVASGVKTVELRRFFTPRADAGANLLIWRSGPQGAVIGAAPIEAVHQLPIAELVERFAGRAASNAARMHAYYHGLTRGFAVALGTFRPFARPLDLGGLRALGVRPPQNFIYAPAALLEALETGAQRAPKTVPIHCSHRDFGPWSEP